MSPGDTYEPGATAAAVAPGSGPGRVRLGGSRVRIGAAAGVDAPPGDDRGGGCPPYTGKVRLRGRARSGPAQPPGVGDGQPGDDGGGGRAPYTRVGVGQRPGPESLRQFRFRIAAQFGQQVVD